MLFLKIVLMIISIYLILTPPLLILLTSNEPKNKIPIKGFRIAMGIGVVLLIITILMCIFL